MAYYGTTAASSLSNPPLRIGGSIGGGANSTAFGVAANAGAKSVWYYNSSHATSDLASASWFSDAYYIGMKTGDLVIGSICTGSSIYPFMGTVGTVSTAGAALTSTGATIWSTR